MPKISRRISPAWLAPVLVPASLLAQEPDAVVVSATRAPRPSLEVPASIDRIHAEEIREGRPQVNLSESLGRVPGIVVQNRQNYAQDLQIQSRGFGARSTFGVRGIRLYADGIPASMPDGQGQASTIALGSARSIEVLRGPFSALYGNSAGGVINAQTEDGPAAPAMHGDVLLGTFRSRRAALKLGGQFGPLNAIGDVSRFETDGYRDHSAAKRDHANVKLRYDVSPDTSLTLVANQLRQPQTQDPGGLTRTLYEQNPRQVVALVEQMDARKTVFHEQSGLTLTQRLGAGTSVQATAYYGERWTEQFLAIPLATQAAVTHSGGVVQLDRGFGGGSLRFSHEMNSFRFSFGAEHERMKDRRKGFLNVNGIAGALKREEDNTVFSTDLYGQVEWKFAERWIANAGVRSSSVRFRNRDYFLSNGDDSGDRAYRATTPVAGLVFRVDSRTSLYASFGKGFETPTFVELANRTGASGLNFGLEASRSRHVEAGAKTIMGRARLSAAVFDIVTENEIVVERNTGGRASFKNVGHTDRRGLEIAAETVGAAPFEARVAYTYLDATYRESFVTQPLVFPPALVTVPAGSMIPGVPRNVLYGELRYRREPFFAQLEGLNKSRVAVNDANSEFADGYLVASFVAGLSQQAAKWKITEFLRIDNVADKKYIGSVIVNEGNGRYYEPSPRRSLTVGLQAQLSL